MLLDYSVCNIKVPYTGLELRKKGAYCIRNLINDKRYVGATFESYRERWGEHIRLLRINKHKNKNIQEDWIKYGENNFEFIILEFVNKKNDILKIEQKYIDIFKNNLYNILMVAGNSIGYKPEESTILKKCKGWVFVSPCNEIYYVINMRKFCRENELEQSHMISIAHRKERQFKGWLAYKKEEFSESLLREDRGKLKKKKYKLINNENIEFITDNLRKFCRDKFLSQSAMYNILNNRTTNYLGWKIQFYKDEEI